MSNPLPACAEWMQQVWLCADSEAFCASRLACCSLASTGRLQGFDNINRAMGLS